MVMRLPGMRQLMATAVVGYSGFSLLLPVSPMWAVEGGADAFGAGLVTTVLMVTTILTQLAAERLLRWLGWSRVLTLGMLALGVPALLQAISPELWLIMLTTAVRGIGFGILTVCGATAIAAIVPARQRGAAIGLYGLAAAVPQLLFMGAGPLLADLLGMPITIAIGVIPVLGVLWTGPLGRIAERALAAAETRDAEGESASTGLAVLRRVALAVASLLVATASAGAVLTFAPQMVADTTVSAVMLFSMMGVSAFARWRVGALTDAWGTRALLWPLMAAGAVGLAAIAVGLLPNPPVPSVVALVAGAVLVGLAYGGLQTATLARAFDDGGDRNRHHVSVAWNVSFDLGTAIGAMVAGAIAVALSFGAAFSALAGVAAVMALVVVATDALRRGAAGRGR